jgi:hypothetical protein
LRDILPLSEITQRPLLVRSGPGKGKSDIFRGYAFERRAEVANDAPLRQKIISRIPAGSWVSKLPEEEQLYGYIDSRVLYWDPTDLKGFPCVDKEAGMSYWLPPAMFPLARNVAAGTCPEMGMWNFEELPSAPPAVQAATYQVMLDREINGEPVAPGWFMVATGNMLGDKGVVSRMPSPLVSRYWHVQLEVSIDDWVKWAIPKRVDHRVIAFFQFMPDHLTDFNPATWKQDSPYCCPRTAHMVSDLIMAWEKTNGTTVPLEVVTGTVGEGVGTELYAYMSMMGRLPNMDDVLANPDSALVPPTDEPGQLFAVGMSLARRATPENADACYRYIKRFPKSFEISTSNAIQLTNPKCAETKAFQKHVVDNADIYTGK